MITDQPFGLVTDTRSDPALGAGHAAIGMSTWRTVVGDARLTFPIGTLFQRTCSDPQDGHFVATSHMCCACTPASVAF